MSGVWIYISFSIKCINYIKHKRQWDESSHCINYRCFVECCYCITHNFHWRKFFFWGPYSKVSQNHSGLSMVQQKTNGHYCRCQHSNKTSLKMYCVFTSWLTTVTLRHLMVLVYCVHLILHSVHCHYKMSMQEGTLTWLNVKYLCMFVFNHK